MDSEKFNSLLRQIDLGDESALVAIQKEFGRQIKGLAYSIIGDWHHSTAILNDVMIILWNKSRKFQNILSPNGCIYDLAKKASYTFYRKYLKKQIKEINIDNLSGKESFIYLVHIDDHSNINYLEMISCLNVIEKEIINKKILFKFTHAEISRDLKMPEGTVKWKYQNILEKLKKNLTDTKNSS